MDAVRPYEGGSVIRVVKQDSNKSWDELLEAGIPVHASVSKPVRQRITAHHSGA